ncbi:MAG: DNA alkylation repair protein [Candidatus Limnocylindria bacterium]
MRQSLPNERGRYRVAGMERFDAADAANKVEDALRVVATPERATSEKRYLKSDLEFLGTTVWQIRAVVGAFAARDRSLTHDDVVALVERLWERPVHERRMAATFTLERYVATLGPGDLPLIERLVRESRTWALVDGLAGDVVGCMIARHEAAATRVLDRWARDDDFWIRRASLLAELRPLRAGAPLDRFARRADGMLDEREFFIRKAIGWVLREAGKRDPESVAAWLAPRTHRASGVTMREAVKYLPPGVSDWLMTAYREGRPGRSGQLIGVVIGQPSRRDRTSCMKAPTCAPSRTR